MKTEQLLLIGGIGAGALYFLSKRPASGSGGGFFGGGTSQERTFTIPANTYTLPQGGYVPAGTYKESQLESIGFVQYPAGSRNWYHYTQLAPTSGLPTGTNTSGSSWYNQVLNYINLGTQLYNTAGTLSTEIAQSIKSTAVDWNNSIVSVNLKFGYITYIGNIDPTTRETKKSFDNTQQIVIEGNGQQTFIKYIQGNQIKKQATIDFYNEKLIGFSAGSVGLSGIYIGNIGNCGCSTEPNYDRVTPMYGIGAVKKKWKVDEYFAREYNRDVDSLKYFVYDLNRNKILEASFSKSEAEYQALDYNADDDNIVVLSLKQLKQRGIPDPRPSMKYDLKTLKKIGAIYNYNHPKSVTHCFDGTYSDAGKGACAYHGGSHEVKVNRKGQRVYTGKGEVMHYVPYRRKYKTDWARSNRKSDKVRTL
jgi:hypothetical protein